MALIKCPECGQEVSDKAQFCPKCAFPLGELRADGDVTIQMPNVQLGGAALMSARDASIQDAKGKLLWKGKHGETAKFHIDEPTRITISLGTWYNPIVGTVQPKKKYRCVQDLGVHWKATYTLSEVDTVL